MGKDNQELNEESQVLHTRIIAGDITAQSELAVLVLPILTRRLNYKFPLLFDPDLIDIAVTDALINYFARPNNYQPTKQSLMSYLFMSAKGDLLNYLKQKKVDENSTHFIEDVELWDSYSEETVGGSVVVDDTNVEEEAFVRLSPITSQLQELFPSLKDQQFVAMMMNGIRETEEYAKVLGIEHLSFIDQKEAVKNHKDRIKKVIIRKIDPKGLRNDK
jgi:DNA-directed RNA polymerase specialized sigma24 family protein